RKKRLGFVCDFSGADVRNTAGKSMFRPIGRQAVTTYPVQNQRRAARFAKSMKTGMTRRAAVAMKHAIRAVLPVKRRAYP
ncbi:MAG: hypothetical protein ACOY4F_00955, partial [Thermodesulfobacteriota bacterium]